MKQNLYIMGGYVLTAIAWMNPITINPVNANTAPTENTAQLTEQFEDFTTFPVGVNVGNRNVIRGVLVRGKEDGSQAINFESWLLPYDTVIQVLRLNVTTLADGQLEVRSPGIVTRINPQTLLNDPELGLVFSIADLKKIFGVDTTFDIVEYAVVLEVPWLNLSSRNIGEPEVPLIFDGLAEIPPEKFNIAAAEQRIFASGSANSSTNFSGDFLAVGTIFDGSWFVRTNQPQLGSIDQWRISEAQFLRQTDQADLFLGSQPTFWQGLGTDDYWGFTYIQRQGFTPPKNFSAGTSDPRQRLQSSQIGRTITGRAEPGSLVQLVQGFGNRILGEIFVDSSGIYRFEDVKVDNRSFNSNYRVFIYPEGRLTAAPEIRDPSFSTVPGQIPAGASAWIFSGGLKREVATALNPSLLGNFSDFRGGLAGRWGLSENLTLGLGGVYDQSLQGLAELFYRPDNFPLEVAVSALGGADLDLIANIRYEPTKNLRATFSSDRFSNRFNVNWNVVRGLSLFATTDSRNPTSGGLQVNYSRKSFFTFARASLDTESNFRWNLLQRFGQLELNQRGNEVGTFSELSYNLSKSSFLNLGHSLLFNYETRAQNSGDDLLTLGWRYRSDERASDGNYVWEAQAGYGMGSQGNGLVASLGTTVLPGVLLRGRYQGVSLTSNQSSFSIDLVSSLNFQGGISPGDRRSNYLRTQGGLLIKTFLDKNNNGKHDPGEEYYTDPEGAMLLVNNQPVKSLRAEVGSDRTKLRLTPGKYRIDVDPAGFPPDWRAETDAFAVNVVAGSYTRVIIPLTQSYSFSGVVTNAEGNALAGARVEAISTDTVQRSFSVTNTAGVYYLEGLQQGEYT
ncbi:carboxypeptidase-like regulatory domain-containing protein, partial [Nodularia sphaerocarpa]